MSFVKKLFGKSGAEKRLNEFQPLSFSAPGLSGAVNKDNNSVSLSRSSGLQENLGLLRRTLQERGSAFRGLRGRVAGTVGEVTQSRLREIRDAGARTVGNLREELSKRRVAGSSFAQREIASTEALFGREAERAAAEGKLSEFALEAEFINQEFESAVSGIEALINQSNFESGLAANFASNASGHIQQGLAVAGQLANARRDRNTNTIFTILGGLFG